MNTNTCCRSWPSLCAPNSNNMLQPHLLRKAYHKLALQEHPDKGGDTERFKSLQTCYDLGQGRLQPSVEPQHTPQHMTKWTARMYILCSCLVPKVRFGSLAWAMERSLPQDQGLKKSDRRIVRFLAALLARLFPTQYAECEKLAKADANFEAFVKDMKCHRYLAREVKFSVMLGSGSSAVAGMVAYIHGVMQGQKPSKSVLASLTLAGGVGGCVEAAVGTFERIRHKLGPGSSGFRTRRRVRSTRIDPTRSVRAYLLFIDKPLRHFPPTKFHRQLAGFKTARTDIR